MDFIRIVEVETSSVESPLDLAELDASLRRVVRLNSTDTSQDNYLTSLLQVAYKSIENAIGRKLGNHTLTVTYAPGQGTAICPRYTSGIPTGWKRDNDTLYKNVDEANEWTQDFVMSFSADDVEQLKAVQRAIVSDLYEVPGMSSLKPRKPSAVLQALLRSYRGGL